MRPVIFSHQQDLFNGKAVGIFQFECVVARVLLIGALGLVDNLVQERSSAPQSADKGFLLDCEDLDDTRLPLGQLGIVGSHHLDKTGDQLPEERLIHPQKASIAHSPA